MIADPSGRPALTNPKTLPIWPGGAASFSITSRGVRDAPSDRPEMNVIGMIARPGRFTQSMTSIIEAETITRPVTNGMTWALNWSANQPPTSTPTVEPIM